MVVVARREINVEWGDCDPAGIVYYPRYFAWFDACTAGLFELGTGLRKIDLLRTYGIIGLPMVDTRAKFILPSKFGDVLAVETCIADFRTSSFTVEHKLFRDGTLAVEGYETRVWVGLHPDDPDRIKSRPIPEDVIAKFMRT
jgi:4-hydroxybenzoyl-CoA thioesterase